MVVDQLPVIPSVPPMDAMATEARIRSQMAKAGVPVRFRGHRFSDYRAATGSAQERALAAARAAVDDRAGCLLLGSVGTGKTHLAAAIVAELAAEGRLSDDFGRLTARFTIVPELLDALRATISHPGADDPLQPLLSVPLLVLDDLGAEKPSEWVVDRLYVLVNHRYNAELVTVATSNYSLNELADRGYERMVSRLCEGSAIVKIEGRDARMVRS
jgi:DNA replication protein DnaC